MARRSIKERLLYKSRKMPNGCIEFTGYKNHLGYGKISVKGKPESAHRVAWSESFGEIPEGMFVCHKCDNRSCINVDHLFIGTQVENMLDMKNKGRRAGKGGVRGEKHCMAKITESDVIAIRNSKKSLRELANDFGITRSYVWNVKNKITWKHI